MSSPASPGPAPTRMIPARTAGVIQFVFENLLRRRLVTGLHQAGKAAAKHTLPEATAFRHAGQTRFQVVAPVAGLLRHASEAGRQQRFDFSRSTRASTGAVPPEEIATSNGERSTIDGKINEHNGWSSTTFTRR